MGTATNNDGEAVASVVPKTNFLVSPSEHFNLDIWHLDFRNFTLGCIDDKQLLGHRSLVFGSSEEDSVPWDLQGLRKVVAKPVGFPIGEGDFCNGESTFVVHVNGG